MTPRSRAVGRGSALGRGRDQNGFDPVISDLDARLRMMDRHGDYAQVLVLAVPPLEEVDPPQAAAELARRANEEMADLVRRFPERFAGFAAALPLGDVEASLIEIDHAVGALGALGVQVFTNVRGAPLDHPRFDPILARMEALDRMIWLHPTRDAAWPDYATERESDFGLWWSLGRAGRRLRGKRAAPPRRAVSPGGRRPSTAMPTPRRGSFDVA